MSGTSTDGPHSMQELLDALKSIGGGDRVYLRDTLEALGERSFTALLLMVSAILITPLSGIPTMPSFGAVLIVLIAVQFFFNRDHVWLPAFLLNRHVNAGKWCRALDWMDKPVAWIDRHTRQDRLTFLTRGVMKRVALLVCIAIALSWPPLELLPMVTSVGAAAVSLFTFGLFARDGLFVALGFVFVGGFAYAIWYFV